MDKRGDNNGERDCWEGGGRMSVGYANGPTLLREICLNNYNVVTTFYYRLRGSSIRASLALFTPISFVFLHAGRAAAAARPYRLAISCARYYWQSVLYIYPSDESKQCITISDGKLISLMYRYTTVRASVRLFYWARVFMGYFRTTRALIRCAKYAESISHLFCENSTPVCLYFLSADSISLLVEFIESHVKNARCINVWLMAFRA